MRISFKSAPKHPSILSDFKINKYWRFSQTCQCLSLLWSYYFMDIVKYFKQLNYIQNTRYIISILSHYYLNLLNVISHCCVSWCRTVTGQAYVARGDEDGAVKFLRASYACSIIGFLTAVVIIVIVVVVYASRNCDQLQESCPFGYYYDAYNCRQCHWLVEHVPYIHHS